MTNCEKLPDEFDESKSYGVKIILENKLAREKVIKFLRKAPTECSGYYCWAEKLADIIEKG